MPSPHPGPHSSHRPASGDGGAIQALIDRTDLPGSPAVHLAILRDTQQYDVTAPATTIPSPSPSPSPTATAAANPCWGANDSVYTRHYWGRAVDGGLGVGRV
jgi:hypothetical protein